MKVFLGGEGPSELGGERARGVVEALLAKATGSTLEVVGTKRWKDIVKYKAGDKRGAEKRNVLGLVEAARKAGAEVVAFTRDRDADVDREKEIEGAIEEAPSLVTNAPKIVGAVAVEMLESWILALKGHANSESISRSKAKPTLHETGITTACAEWSTSSTRPTSPRSPPTRCRSTNGSPARAADTVPYPTFPASSPFALTNCSNTVSFTFVSFPTSPSTRFTRIQSSPPNPVPIRGSPISPIPDKRPPKLHHLPQRLAERGELRLLPPVRLHPEVVNRRPVLAPDEHVAEPEAPVRATRGVLLEHPRPPLLEPDGDPRVHPPRAVASVREGLQPGGGEDVAFREMDGHARDGSQLPPPDANRYGRAIASSTTAAIQSRAMSISSLARRRVVLGAFTLLALSPLVACGATMQAPPVTYAQTHTPGVMFVIVHPQYDSLEKYRRRTKSRASED